LYIFFSGGFRPIGLEFRCGNQHAARYGFFVFVFDFCFVIFFESGAAFPCYLLHLASLGFTLASLDSWLLASKPTPKAKSQKPSEAKVKPSEAK